MQITSHPLTLEECFRDFNTRFPKNDPRRLLLGEFTGASQNPTITRWLNGKNNPTGGNKWRSIAFFSQLGYTIPQFVNIRPLYQRAIKLFALGVMDARTLAIDGFGFQGATPTDKMYQAFEYDRSILEEREPALRQFINQHAEDLEVAKQLFDEQYGAAKLPIAIEVVAPILTVVPTEVVAPLTSKPMLPKAPEKTKPKLSHDTILQSAAHLVQGLKPLLELIVSDAFTAEERAVLRELAGRDDIFKLSNVFDQLCSERARSQSNKQETKR